MQHIDEDFLGLGQRALADAALARARELGATYADVRVERVQDRHLVVRDRAVASSSATSSLALSVRVIVDGAWGFAAGDILTTDAAATLVERAAQLARISGVLTPQPVQVSPEPAYVEQTWCTDYVTDPFTLADADIAARLQELSEVLHAHPAVSHTQATTQFAKRSKFFANLDGTVTWQQTVATHPQIQATHVGDGSFCTMRTLAAPSGRGFEYLHGDGWDFDAEVASLGEHLAELAAAPAVVPGHYDLVIDPTNLWLTIHESIGHGTELDRALGYEAAYAGTSFATFDQLGTLKYGSELLNVVGERNSHHGLASVGWDDEGVAAQEFPIISEGTLVGYQLNRQMAAEMELGRSNGCAFAENAANIPMQRMPNVSVLADPAGGSTEDLIGDVKDGLYVVGDKSWSIDMQRHNFQFTGQRWFKIKDGKLAGQVKDAAYQAITTQFWGSLEGVGGPDTWYYAGAMNCGKGQPGQTAPVSHGAPSVLVRDVNVLNIGA